MAEKTQAQIDAEKKAEADKAEAARKAKDAEAAKKAELEKQEADRKAKETQIAKDAAAKNEAERNKQAAANNSSAIHGTPARVGTVPGPNASFEEKDEAAKRAAIAGSPVLNSGGDTASLDVHLSVDEVNSMN